MRMLLALIVMLNFGGLLAFAQNPFPPPPPLIYSAPKDVDIKEFVSEEGKFKVSFAGAPKVEKNQTSEAITTNYKIYRQGSNSVVATNDFSIDLESIKDKFFELVKTNILKNTKAKITEEKEIQIDGKTGKEFVVDYGMTNLRIRILPVGKRVYEINSDVTNWHIIGEKTKKEFEKETERFFNSFRLIQK
jgi:hypothetical protein